MIDDPNDPDHQRDPKRDLEHVEETPGAFAYEGLDRVLHEKARLGILTALASQVQGVGFVELKGLCQLTDGNLSRHLKVLEEAGLVEIRKRPQGTRTRTTALLTRGGRAQFLRYLDELERVIRDARPRAEGAGLRDGDERESRGDAPYWSPA